MEQESLWGFFKSAKLSQKSRLVLLVALGGLVTAGTVLAISAILRMHFLRVAMSPDIDEIRANLEARSAAAAKVSAQYAAGKNAERRTASAAPAGVFPFPYEIKNMTVPIGNRTGNKALYLQFTIQFDCPSAEVRDRLQLNRAKLRNSLYEVALRFNEEDFRTPEGFQRFKSAIEANLRENFHADAPRAVAFRDWLVN